MKFTGYIPKYIIISPHNPRQGQSILEARTPALTYFVTYLLLHFLKPFFHSHHDFLIAGKLPSTQKLLQFCEKTIIRGYRLRRSRTCIMTFRKSLGLSTLKKNLYILYRLSTSLQD